MHKLLRLLIFAAALLLIAALIGSLVLIRQRQSAARRLAIWQAQREEDQVAAAYGQSFDWERANLTLDQFGELITAKTGLSVETEGRRRILLVPRGNFPLHSLLSIVLAPQGWCARLDWQKITITAPASAAASSPVRTIVYPLPPVGPRGLTEAEWFHLIDGNITANVMSVPGALLVV